MANEVTIHVKAKDDASKQMSAIGAGAKKMGGIAAAAGAAAGAALVKFGIDSVKAASEAQEAQTRLADALAKFPKLADTNITKLNALNASLQEKTRADDEAIASGQAVLAQFDLTGKQLEQMTPLLVDYARKTGKEMPDAAKALGKALMGNGRALKEIGIDFKDTGDPAKNFALIMDGLREKVGGFAEKEGKTLAGRLDILRNRFGEIQEKVGTSLIPILEDVADAIGDMFDNWEDSGRMAQDMEDLAEAARNAQEAFQGFGDANSSFQDMILDQKQMILGWRITMLKGLIAVADAWGKLSPNGRRVAKELRGMLAETRGDFVRTANEINKKKIEPKIRADKRELERKARAAERELAALNRKKATPKVNADTARAMAKLAAIRASLSMLPQNKQIYVTTYYRKVVGGGKQQAFAQGGNVGHAAEGGPRGNQVLVGEGGPEIVDLPLGSHVNSNPDSQRMMATGGKGGGDTHFHFHGPVYGDHNALRRALVNMKRSGQLDVVLR